MRVGYFAYPKKVLTSIFTPLKILQLVPFHPIVTRCQPLESDNMLEFAYVSENVQLFKCRLVDRLGFASLRIACVGLHPNLILFTRIQTFDDNRLPAHAEK